MKKLVSVILSLSLILSVFAFNASATVKADCGGECEKCPSIVVPGIGQSNVWALDENGDYLLDADGDRISAFPAVVNVGSIVAKAVVPVLLTLITQRDMGLSAALRSILLDAFSSSRC